MGCMLYELATGIVLFDVDNDTEHMDRIRMVTGMEASVPHEVGDITGEGVRTSKNGNTGKTKDLLLSTSQEQEHFTDLLETVWRYDRQQRLGASTALKHEWFRDVLGARERSTRSRA
ncbi:hypothetical protein NX059_012265 [Plenodomus lindquistii]|nr:hypothetical protein NX059_012265 [Plenodomus lindquistii]